MRAALISLPGVEGEASAIVAGRSVAARQLDFALACGCELVVVHGHGASREAIALRHRAEAAGARFQTITHAQALIGLVGEGDSLLALQPGLLPAAPAAIADLAEGARVLVLPAGPGVLAGFERIDLDRAWAGALVVPGHLLARLATLPEDIAPAPALLRVALQNRVAETRLPPGAIEDGSWTLLRSPEQARAFESGWLRRAAGLGGGSALSRRIAGLVLHRRGGALAEQRWAGAGLLGGFVLTLIAALAAARFAQPWLAFALVALAAPVGEAAIGLARIRAAPFGSARHWPKLRHLVDATLGVCAVLTIEGLWYRSLFGPVVLIAGLVLLDRRALAPRMQWMRDRGVVAAALAALAGLAMPEPAVMALAVLVLGGLVLADNRAPPGKRAPTPDGG